jgi:hypothetical protein
MGSDLMVYKAKYTFQKNIKGQWVGQSTDGMHTFIMPINLESKEVQNKMFKFFLHKAMEDVREGQTIVEPTGEIRVSSNSFNRMIQSLEDVKDEHVAMAIADYMVKHNQCGWSNESFVILEAMNESTFDKEELIHKWILFYEYSIDSLEKVYNNCNEAVKVFNDKVSKLPNASELAKQEALKAKIDYETMVEKEKQSPLTADERRKKEKAAVNFLQFAKQHKVLVEKESPLLELMRSRIEHIEGFINKTEITKAVMGDAKAILELGGSIDFKELMAVVNNLSTVAGKITSGCIMFEQIKPSEITKENMQEFCKLLSTEINDIDGIMDTATKEVERISETRKKLETSSNAKTSSLNTNIV